MLGEFRSWMRKHRGLTDTTLDVYEGILSGLLDALGDDVRDYSAEALRAFVLDRARPHGIYRAKSIVVAVRSFVRFLGVTGRCSAGMEWLTTAAVIVRAIVAALLALVWRQGWREGSTVEMPRRKTIIGASPRPHGEPRTGEYVK